MVFSKYFHVIFHSKFKISKLENTYHFPCRWYFMNQFSEISTQFVHMRLMSFHVIHIKWTWFITERVLGCLLRINRQLIRYFHVTFLAISLSFHYFDNAVFKKAKFKGKTITCFNHVPSIDHCWTHPISTFFLSIPIACKHFNFSLINICFHLNLNKYIHTIQFVDNAFCVQHTILIRTFRRRYFEHWYAVLFFW